VEIGIRRAVNFLNGKRIVRDETINSADAIDIIGSLEGGESLFSDGSLRFRAFWDKPRFSTPVGLSPEEAKKCVEEVFKDAYLEEIGMQVYADSRKNRFVYLDMPLPQDGRYGFTISFRQEPERVALDFMGCRRSLQLIRESDLIEGIDMEIVDREGNEYNYFKQTPEEALKHLNSDSVAPFMMFEERLIGARIFLEDYVRKRQEVQVSLSGNGSYPARVQMKYTHRMKGVH